MRNNNPNKTLIFILLILAFIGIIGGIGYTIYCKAYIIGIGLVAAGYVAWPRFKELFDELTN